MWKTGGEVRERTRARGLSSICRLLLTKGEVLATVTLILYPQVFRENESNSKYTLCPVPGDTQGQAGWGLGQPEPMGGSPVHGRN